MTVSTRGRYALRVLLRLADHPEQTLSVRAIAEAEEISKKYMEQIMPLLVAGGLVSGVSGKYGGYRLAKSPEQITVGEVLRLTEGELAPVSCLATGAEPCHRRTVCRTLRMWQEFEKVTYAYFDGITLASLLIPPTPSPAS